MAKRSSKHILRDLLLKLSSLKITVVCLLLLFILTFWGTIAQVEHGLYSSQLRYFNSFYFLALKFIPFPGVQLVLWVLFVNLVAAFLTRMKFIWPKFGYLTAHVGVLLFFVAAFMGLHFSKESHLNLREGQASNVSSSYGDWELAVWEGKSQTRRVTAIDIRNLKPGDVLNFQSLGLSFTVKEFYKNAEAYMVQGQGSDAYINNAGIGMLKAVALDKEPGKNMAGIILRGSGPKEILLYGAEIDPTQIGANGKQYFMALRHRRYPLPITVKLLDFMMEKHPGTEVARSFKSRVEIEHDGITREVLISMNEPLRFKNYTFYQASYQIDAMGREYSTLAVVRNSGRLLPYIATFVVVFGLGLHFLTAAFKYQRKQK